MLDSSPLPVPPPPRQLKRTASVASLPSPPPSVQPPRKRANSVKFDSDIGSGSETDDDDANSEDKQGVVIGRKLLFPAVGPSTSSRRDETDDPFLDTLSSSEFYKDTFSSRVTNDPASPPCSILEVSPQPTTKSPRTPPPPPSTTDKRGRWSRSEIPTLDEDENPFIDSPPSKRRSRRTRSPVVEDITEKPTLTYVFKGIKTSLPNPNYNLPESVYERARLPLCHPDYSPLPVCKPQRLFQEVLVLNMDAGEVEEQCQSAGESDKLRTPDAKQRRAKYFVDAAGNPLPDSGPQPVRGKTMDAMEIGRMAVGPLRRR